MPGPSTFYPFVNLGAAADSHTLRSPKVEPSRAKKLFAQQYPKLQQIKTQICCLTNGLLSIQLQRRKMRDHVILRFNM